MGGGGWLRTPNDDCTPLLWIIAKTGNVIGLGLISSSASFLVYEKRKEGN